MSRDSIVELRDVYFTYGCHPVLDGVDLDIISGEAVGITGPNGSGKTTLLKLILGQLRPQRGVVRLFGTEITSFKERYRVGYISQNARFFNKSFPATAREVVASGRVAARGIMRRLSKDDYNIVEEALDTVGMLQRGNQLVGNMSGGQQQRVLLARALASQPLLLIMDEPSAGLDRTGKNELYTILSKLNTEKGVTLVLVSHDVDEITPLITRKVCLDKKLCSCERNIPDTGKTVPAACSQRLALV